MFKNLKISAKLVLAMMTAGLVPLSIVGYLAFRSSSEALEEQAKNQLVSVRDIKKAQIESYFNERRGDMSVLVETVKTLREEAFKKLAAIRQIKKSQIERYFAERKGNMGVLVETVKTLREGAFSKLVAVREIKKTQIEGYFQARFALLTDVQMNLRFTTGVSAFAGALAQGGPTGKVYGDLYNQRAKGLQVFRDMFGFSDVFLISPKGQIVFCLAREADRGASLVAGQYRESGLAKAFQRGKTESVIVDFSWYEPSNEPAVFFATPLKDNANKLIGVAAFQVAPGPINRIMQERKGLGKTGETYLIGPDKLMRSDSYLDPAGHSVKASLKGSVEDNGCDTDGARKALAGNAGHSVIIDYNGNLVLSAYAPLKIKGLNWAILAEIDVAEAFSPKIEGEVDDYFTKYKQQYGYYDLFLINPDGYCYYSVAKESDYKTNLVNGRYRDSGLGKLVRKVLQTKEYGLQDFEPYAPSNNEAAAFCAQPVIDKGEVQAVVALQMPLEFINAIMQERSGMGKTGETYLVGLDKRMRSNSFLDPQGHSVKASFAGTIEKNGCDTQAAREALAGKAAEKVIIDYNGNSVLSAYAPIELGDFTWAILAEIDVAEAFSPKIEGEADDYFTKYKQQYGYYDLFLINPDGYCYYSVAKESDYQTNFVNGRYRDSGLGKLVRRVLQSKRYGLEDFAPYAPSNDEPAAFIAKPVVGAGGEVQTIVALQLPLEGINNIMQERSGMGKTGETYLVGSDNLMRSDSYLNKQTHSVIASFKNNTRVETDGVKEALAGTSDAKLIDDYRGAPVYSAYCPVKVEDTKWALLAEIDEAEALAPVVSLRNTIVTIGIIIGALVAIGGFLMARTISLPLTRVVERLREIAEGRADLTQKIEATSNDEIGQLGQSFNQLADTMNELSTVAQRIADGDLTVEVTPKSEKDALGNAFAQMIENLQEMANVATMIAEGDLTAKVTPKSERDALGNAFAKMVSNLESMVSQIIATSNQVGTASGDVTTTAQQSATGAQQQLKGVEQISSQTAEVSNQMEEVSSQIEEMASGIEQASATVDSQLEFVQRVSSTMEEMSASVAAVSENAAKSQNQGKDAVTEAQKGQDAVQAATQGMEEISATIGELATVIGSLGQRSNQIGDIVDTITGIASQTNLLALNAAIEAARAGEHGRGFAVVADEVRKLAERTAQATEEIETLVKGIQDESQNAVRSTEQGIEKVKQGTALTNNVGTVLVSIVGSIQDTAEAIQGILASTEEQATAAKDVTGAVGELTGMSKQIAKGMNEQSKGAQQISQAVAQTAKAMEETSSSVQEVSGITNQVAAGAQEMASSAEELSAQSAGLLELMAQFTLSNGGEKAVAGDAGRSASGRSRPVGRAAGQGTAGPRRARQVPVRALQTDAGRPKRQGSSRFGPKPGGDGDGTT